VVPASNDYSFAQISGTVGATQLSGNYASAFANPLSGSSNYIQNGTSQQTGTNFNIDGNGTLGGQLSAANINTSGTYKLGGATVLNALTSNVFVGPSAGVGTTSATFTTFVGNFAGQNNTTGGGNTFVGYQAGLTNTASGGSTYIGSKAGILATGGGNTAIGTNVAGSLTTGTFNIVVGNGTGSNLTTGNQNIYIAGSGSGNESNTIRIGNSNQTATFIAGIGGATSSGGINVLVNSSGQLGTTTSSRRYKDNITDMGSASSKLFQLRPVTFFYKPQFDDGSHILQYGLIAEEVAKVYPDLVVYGEDGQPQTVRYHLLTPMLLNEMQKQNKVITAQQGTISSQQQLIEQQQTRMSAQQQQIDKLQTQNEEIQQRLSRLETLLGTRLK
jgi:hypothetical protein